MFDIVKGARVSHILLLEIRCRSPKNAFLGVLVNKFFTEVTLISPWEIEHVSFKKLLPPLFLLVSEIIQ